MQGIPLTSKEPITLQQSIIAGAFSGLPVCLLLTPAELIKCRLQVEGMNPHTANLSTQPWQLVRQIVAKDGIAGLYRGNLITVAREIPSGAAIYVAYDISKNFFDSHVGPLMVTPLICGAIGGVATTLASYPQDIIKTNIQVAETGKHHGKLSISQVAQNIYYREGFSGFWRGFLPSATRAVLVESITFLVYDFCKNLFDPRS
jgi:solute carrier family 25 carnitine/acylcarnitine transporter 20/29